MTEGLPLDEQRRILEELHGVHAKKLIALQMNIASTRSRLEGLGAGKYFLWSVSGIMSAITASTFYASGQEIGNNYETVMTATTLLMAGVLAASGCVGPLTSPEDLREVIADLEKRISALEQKIEKLNALQELLPKDEPAS